MEIESTEHIEYNKKNAYFIEKFESILNSIDTQEKEEINEIIIIAGRNDCQKWAQF